MNFKLTQWIAFDFIKSNISQIKFYTIALAIYFLFEIILYKIVKFYFVNYNLTNFDYLNWIYYFYFPEKKIFFFYYVAFLLSSWMYFSILILVNEKNKS